MSLQKRIDKIAQAKNIDMDYIVHKAGYYNLPALKRALRSEAVSYKKLKKIAKALQVKLNEIV